MFHTVLVHASAAVAARGLVGCFALAAVLGATAQVADSLVAEGIPAVPADLVAGAGRYLESRSAGLSDWHPRRREILITTRFADATQLHAVRAPGGARRQLTFQPEPVSGGLYDPQAGAFVVFSQDNGGGEFYQLYRLDLGDGRVTRLTDGKSRNTGPRGSHEGQWLAYTSTRRNGRDTDVYLIDPRRPETDRRLTEVQGGGWSVADWSYDGTQLALRESISANESRLHLCDVATGTRRRVTPDSKVPVAWNGALFARDGRALFVTTDLDSEFQRLGRLDLATAAFAPLGAAVRGDIEAFDLSADGRRLAYVGNEGGASVLRLLDVRSGRELPVPKLPLGVVATVKWSHDGRELAFTLNSARSPADVYTFNPKSGAVERWTESEIGGLNATELVEPEAIRVKSFDDLELSGFLYRPDPQKFPGPRPVLVNIHGGPEGQSRPIFQGRNNYWVNELGVALFYPNVRGSTGFGKTFLTLDNGFKREDSVRDIGAFLDWIARDPRLDGSRVGVMGGSYGGYMTLACLAHYSDRLRCGLDSVGISNFLTFLKNTQDYRRDLRRVEYGDERDPAMAEFLGRISPANQAGKIRKPLFVAQGLNDPRVPVSESEQMVKAIRNQGGTVWYLLAKDEGHGFQKKRNVDQLFYSQALFVRQHLVD